MTFDSQDSGFYQQLTKVHRDRRLHLIKQNGIGPSELHKSYLREIPEVKIQEALNELQRDQGMLVSKVGFDNKF